MGHVKEIVVVPWLHIIHTMNPTLSQVWSVGDMDVLSLTFLESMQMCPTLPVGFMMRCLTFTLVLHWATLNLNLNQLHLPTPQHLRQYHVSLKILLLSPKLLRK